MPWESGISKQQRRLVVRKALHGLGCQNNNSYRHSNHFNIFSMVDLNQIPPPPPKLKIWLYEMIDEDPSLQMKLIRKVFKTQTPEDLGRMVYIGHVALSRRPAAEIILDHYNEFLPEDDKISMAQMVGEARVGGLAYNYSKN